MNHGTKHSRNRKDALALTDDARQQQLIAKAERLAEQKLEDGTASPQIIVHYLRLGTERERRQNELLEVDMELKKAKIDAIHQAAKIEELFNDAVTMFRKYSGTEEETDEDV